MINLSPISLSFSHNITRRVNPLHTYDMQRDDNSYYKLDRYISIQSTKIHIIIVHGL